MSTNKLFVTICVQTYNHEKYISQCLDSLLMQESTYDYEILIGEDDSDDNTRKICIDYAEKYPDKIRLNLNRREDVIHINGKPSGRANMLKNLSDSRGKYIALCEGDDYWIDPLKIQKQVDFLELNPDFVATTSNTYYLRDGETKYTYIESKELWLNRKMQSEIHYEDIPQRMFPHTTTWMFRREAVHLNDEFKEYPIGDMPLFMLLANQGRINYSKDVYTVYRVHNEGALGTLRKVDPLQNLEAYAKMYTSVNRHCENQYTRETGQAIIDDHKRLLKSSPSIDMAKKNHDQLKRLTSQYNIDFRESRLSFISQTLRFQFVNWLKGLKQTIWKVRKNK